MKSADSSSVGRHPEACLQRWNPRSDKIGHSEGPLNPLLKNWHLKTLENNIKQHQATLRNNGCKFKQSKSFFPPTSPGGSYWLTNTCSKDCQDSQQDLQTLPPHVSWVVGSHESSFPSPKPLWDLSGSWLPAMPRFSGNKPHDLARPPQTRRRCDVIQGRMCHPALLGITWTKSRRPRFGAKFKIDSCRDFLIMWV